MRFWRNTSAATLPLRPTTLTLPLGTLGYEWDADAGQRVPSGRPDAPVHAPPTTCRPMLKDYGSTYGAGHRHAPHDAVPHAAPRSCSAPAPCSGPGASTRITISSAPPVQRRHAAGDRQPVRRHGRAAGARSTAGLIAASPSTDTTPPVSTIQSPAAGATLLAGEHPVTISGIASRRRRRRRRRRGLGRWRRHVARGDRARDLDLPVDAVDRRAHGASRAAPWTTAATSRRRAPGRPSPSSLPRSIARAASGTRRRRRRCRATSTIRTPIELGVRFRVAGERLHHRRALLQGRGRTPAPHIGHLWTNAGVDAGPGDVHQRDRHRAGSGSLSRRRCRLPRTRPTSRRITRRRDATRSTGRTSRRPGT